MTAPHEDASGEAYRNSAPSERTPGIELGILDGFVGMLLRRAYEEAFADFTRLLGSDALSPAYFTILTLIANNPGITQVEIGRAAGRDKSAVTVALRYMEDQGLIRRVRLRDDRRSSASYMTEAGATLNARMQEKAQLHIARMDEIIGEGRKQSLVETLQDLADELPRRYGHEDPRV